MLYCTVFRTRWGWFSLAGEGAVSRACLPLPRREMAEQELLEALGPAAENARFDRAFLPDLQQQIVAYFEGEPVDFRTVPLITLDHTGTFGHRVLCACRAIPFGRTRTYAGLAGKVGHPGAARAVGTALAGNPIPLIIPCHRVLRSDGGLGGFSAPGGTATKQKLLDHEQGSRRSI
jgi:methylated-DNA-[protein]-cysteine S-methyltransferase